jgi:hypothetical protein
MDIIGDFINKRIINKDQLILTQIISKIMANKLT